LVDAELIDVTNSAEKVDKATTLLALLNSEVVECHRYVNGLPPAGIKPVEVSGFAPPYPVYAGWAVAYPFETESRHWPVVYSLKPGKTYAVGGIRDNYVERAHNDESQSVYRELGREQRGEMQALDMLALRVAAQVLEADVFITHRPYLYSKSDLLST
jgi:hypothetical protein